MGDFIMNPWTIGVGTTTIASLVLYFVFGTGKSKNNSNGGKGGNASVKKGVAIGGKGGASGPGGRGGDGGSGKADEGFVMGGEGGGAGQANRGGKGGRSPLEILGMPNVKLPDGRNLWDVGRGGDGASPKNFKKSSKNI